MRLIRLLFVCFVVPAAYAQNADLSVSVSAPATVVASGDTAIPTATFSITNAGPATVPDATVDFTPGLAVDLPGFTCATVTDHVRCTIASFPPGTFKGSGSMQLQYATDGTIVTISATVASATVFDPNHANDSSTAYERVKWQSNIGFTSTDFPSVRTLGSSQENIARIYYEANGPTYATDVQITIHLTGGISPRSASNPAFTCVTPHQPSSDTIVCTAKKLEPAVSSGFIEFSYVYDAYVGQTVFLNAAMTCSDAPAPPRDLIAGLRIVDPAYVMVSVDAPASVESGTSFATNVTVQNTGPAAALYATVEFSVTRGAFAFGVPTPAPGWACDSTSTGVTCSTNSFPPGFAKFSFPIVLPPDGQPGYLLQTVVADSATDGYPPWRNGATTWISPEKLPAFQQTIDGPSAVYLGSTASYTITVTNTSANDAADPVLDLGLSSPRSVLWNCPDPRGAMRCGLGDMPAGSTRTIVATVPVVIDPNSTSTKWAMWVQSFVNPGTPAATYYTPPGTPAIYVKSTVLPSPPRRRSVTH
jgi:hypothetical protein